MKDEGPVGNPNRMLASLLNARVIINNFETEKAVISNGVNQINNIKKTT